MSDFVARAHAYSTQSGERSPSPWLSSYRQQAGERWCKLAFPHRKTENWKYTSLRSIDREEIFSGEATCEQLSASTVDDVRIDGLDSIDFVFVNGHFDAELSANLDDLPDGVECVLFSQANDTQQAKIRESLGAIASNPSHLFVTLNNSALQEGLLVNVARNCRLERPLRVVHVTQAQSAGSSCFPRVLVNIEESAEATVMEHFASEGQVDNIWVNSVIECRLNANAKLRHYRLHLEDESALHIGGVHAQLAAHSTFDSFQLALGAKLKRIDVVVNHAGPGAHCELNGVYLPRNNQQVDFHTCIEHAVPHCTTNEVFRGIISDTAKAVFNGRIHIHPQAQKTLAQLSNKNLLTSNKAEVDTKPELEIYADDVQCAHGATVAQLDDMAMHYLTTRGISPDEAKVMLSFGFINQLINEINDAPVADYVRPRLTALFSRDPELLRHIAQ